MIDFKRHRFPPIVIITAVRWYLRFKLSLSDIVEFLIERKINVSRETIREWVQKFGPQVAKLLDIKRRKIGNHWHVDETYVKIAGEWKYLYRAIDENMEPIDIYLSNHRDKKAAKQFFRKCISTVGFIPKSIISDSHKGYNQVKDLFPETQHYQVKYLNNKAESSHVPLKQRYRPMRGFKNVNLARTFLESFESLYRFFRKIKPYNRKMRELYAVKLTEFNLLIS